MGAVVQLVSHVRGHMINYMCQLSDQELRVAASHNMMDLLWSAVKEPLESHMSFDEEGLKLAFKYFSCSTLTIRLTGISQINVSQCFTLRIWWSSSKFKVSPLAESDLSVQ